MASVLAARPGRRHPSISRSSDALDRSTAVLRPARRRLLAQGRRSGRDGPGRHSFPPETPPQQPRCHAREAERPDASGADLAGVAPSEADHRAERARGAEAAEPGGCGQSVAQEGGQERRARAGRERVQPHHQGTRRRNPHPDLHAEGPGPISRRPLHPRRRVGYRRSGHLRRVAPRARQPGQRRRRLRPLPAGSGAQVPRCTSGRVLRRTSGRWRMPSLSREIRGASRLWVKAPAATLPRRCRSWRVTAASRRRSTRCWRIRSRDTISTRRHTWRTPMPSHSARR